MDKSLALGTTAFAVVSVVTGLAVQVILDRLGARSALVGQATRFVVAIPLALIAGRRVGRVTHVSVLLASTGLALATLWVIVHMLDALAVPAGAHVGWRSLFSAWSWRDTIVGSLATLLAPQIWLAALDRMTADNASRATPLLGAA